MQVICFILNFFMQLLLNERRLHACICKPSFPRLFQAPLDMEGFLFRVDIKLCIIHQLLVLSHICLNLRAPHTPIILSQDKQYGGHQVVWPLHKGIVSNICQLLGKNSFSKLEFLNLVYIYFFLLLLFHYDCDF